MPIRPASTQEAAWSSASRFHRRSQRSRPTAAGSRRSPRLPALCRWRRQRSPSRPTWGHSRRRRPSRAASTYSRRSLPPFVRSALRVETAPAQLKSMRSGCVTHEEAFSTEAREGRWAHKNLIAVYIHITNIKYKVPSRAFVWENRKISIEYSIVICNNILI